MGVAVRETVIRPLGLLTQSNKYGQYPAGAMSRALNVCMRDPGIVSSLPATRAYRSDVISAGYTLRRLWPGATSVLALGNNGATWALRWVSAGASNAVTAPPGWTALFSDGKAHAAQIRSRTLLSWGESSPWIFDSEGDTTARLAGLPAPELSVVSLSTSNAQALPTAKVVAYRAIIRRAHSDGYETISAPSQPIHITNSIGSTHNPVLRVSLPGNAGGTLAIAGDIVELYKSRTVDAGSDPGDTLYLAVAYTLVSGDITARNCSVTDNALESSLAAELYSNPAQDGVPTGAKSPPTIASDVAVFKGYTFYAATRLRSSKSLKIPGPIGTLSSAAERATGIGVRTVTGDVANGSPDILNVSDTTGLSIGQRISIAGNAMNGANVTNIVGTTVTVDVASDATTVGASIDFSDRLVLNGTLSTLTTTFEPNSSAHSSGARMIYEGAVSYVFTGASTWTITWPATFIVENVLATTTELTLKATNGANYYPALPNFNDTAVNGSSDPRENRYAWSLEQQPEAVPAVQYAFVGSGTLYRMVPTQDSMLMFCSDGLYRLTGDGGEWRTDPVDPTLILAARNAADVLNDVVWAYTNEGLVAIDGSGLPRYVSRDRVGDPANLPGAAYADTWDTFLSIDERHHEVWLTFRSGSNSVSYVYNVVSGAFTTVDDSAEWSAMAYSRSLRSLVVGAVSSNPDVLYFEDDTSATRMAGADPRLQPLYMGDPFTLKQFIGVDHLFSGVGTAMTLVPSYDGTNYTALTVPANAIESRIMAPVPRNAPAIGTRITPGFTISVGGTSNNWSWRGASVSWVPAAEESVR